LDAFFFGYKEKHSKVIKTYIIGRLKRFFKIWGSIKKIYYNRYILVNKNVKRLVLIKINRGSISNKLTSRKKINEKNMYYVYKNYLTYEYLWLPAWACKKIIYKIILDSYSACCIVRWLWVISLLRIKKMPLGKKLDKKVLKLRDSNIFDKKLLGKGWRGIKLKNGGYKSLKDTRKKK